MGDVANILGVQTQRGPASAAEEATKILAARPVVGGNKKAPKPKGMSREVYSLMSADSITAVVPSNTKVVSGLKNKRASLVHGKWVWAPFTNSARGDGVELHHWVKASIEYPDYPYAKFNNRIEAVTYSTEEYDVLLQSSNWNRSETDHLMDLCYQYDLRWPVIVDRYTLLPPRTLDEIRTRYYYVVARLKRSRTGIPEAAAKSENYVTFDIDYEKQRRANLELQFRKTKESELEELRLKEEMKAIDASMKKLKKAIPGAAGGAAGSKSQGSEYKPARGVGRPPASAVKTEPGSTGSEIYAYDPKIPPKPHVPTPGRPYLQSSRLLPDDPKSLNISKSRQQKLDILLTELGLPENVIPTRAVCDLHDEIRKDAIVLLTLQHTIAQKEADLAGFQSQMKPRVLAQQKQKILDFPVTDLLVSSLSQKNNRIQQEVEEQLQAAKKLADSEFVQPLSSAAIAAEFAIGAPTSEEVPVKREVKHSKRKLTAMSAAIAVTKDMVAEGNVPALSFVVPLSDDGEGNPKGPKRRKNSTSSISS